ncbi:MAG: RagB/SusD family nutrient uptake outer membrane protein [Bacteroidota bacterium]|nr:RagB/SusD family nutrient uptake outer membrane protein [Bacteroidota bacterium]MDP4269650.1 RagB/SusD family nutrient uptake outer membrane protein [Bacteroidota bacterium]
MKCRNYIYTFFIASCAFLSSCNSALDQAPDGKLSLDEVFKDNDKVAAYLNTCYKNMSGKGNMYFFFERGPACWSDEAWDADDLDVNWAGSARYYSGNASAADHPSWGVTGQGANCEHYWDHYFTSIHDCAYFLQNIGKATVTNESDRSRWTAEAHLLRAYYYSELLRWFGCGMPIVETPYDFTQDFSKVKRASYYETVQFIIKECDVALACNELPWRITTSDEAGRLPKSIAYAIKSRMMLYAASPLYCGDKNYWNEAYTVTKAALAGLRAQGYELYNTLHDPNTYLNSNCYFGPDGYPLSAKSAMCNEYFTNTMEYSSNPVDKETIFQTRWSSLSFDVEGIGAQRGYKTGTCPSQELVDCFETLDGQPILNLSKPYNDEETHLDPNYNSANTLYNPQDPYKDRDPRFYADIYYNGSKRYCWWPFAESAESPENFPANADFRTRNIMTYIGEPRTGTSANGRTATRTGYFIRKYMTPTTSDNNGTYRGEANYKEFRLAEVILNFAEAAAHAGHEDEAIIAVNEIRSRVGMPGIPSTTTGQDLLNRIINERRVELALEEARYFDVRRLHKPNEDLVKTDKWVTAAYIIRNSDGTYTYSRKPVNNTPRQCYTNKWLKSPIPLNEVNRMIAISGENWQNPGW